jgi:hypothetical protein
MSVLRVRTPPQYKPVFDVGGIQGAHGGAGRVGKLEPRGFLRSLHAAMHATHIPLVEIIACKSNTRTGIRTCSVA